MYYPHPIFETPVDRSIKIWKCFDLLDFIKILIHKSLLFINTKELFTDHDINILFKNSIKDFERWSYFTNRLNPLCGNFDRNLHLDYSLIFKKNLLNYFFTSWYMNSYESASMWNSCIKDGKSILIQSTCEKLIKSFASNTSSPIWIGMVNYIDYNNYTLNDFNVLRLLVSKRKSFEHEHELLVITKHVEENNNYSMNKIKEKKMNIDLNLLIENIYIFDSTPVYVLDILDSLLKKYNLETKEMIKGYRNTF